MAEYSLVPVDVPKIKTKYRSIQTAIPVPESLPIFEKLKTSEPRSMLGQPPIIWNSADNFTWNGVGYGQFTGVLVTREPEMLYFDHS